MLHANQDPLIAWREPPPHQKSAAERFRWETLLLVVAAVGAVGLWGAHAIRNPSESITRIRNHPAEYRDRLIQIRGEVGQVFDMGGSCAYYLHQGRDTIVVFTRGARPLPRQKRSVRGTVSIGYLDGEPRPALFESGRQP